MTVLLYTMQWTPPKVDAYSPTFNTAYFVPGTAYPTFRLHPEKYDHWHPA